MPIHKINFVTANYKFTADAYTGYVVLVYRKELHVMLFDSPDVFHSW